MYQLLLLHIIPTCLQCLGSPQRDLSRLVLHCKAPPLLCHPCMPTHSWMKVAFAREIGSKGITIIYAVFAWVSDVLNRLGNTLKIQNELISFLQTLWSSPGNPDNLRVRAETLDYLWQGNSEFCRERIKPSISLKAGGLGHFYLQIHGGVRRASGIACIVPCSSMSWIGFYKHSLCFITAGYAVSLLWRCRVTPD